MRDVTIQLQAETERRLKEKAEQDGQSLEAFLQQLAEHAAGNGNGSPTSVPEADNDELAERPWRGVFVPPRKRDVLFSQELPVPAEQLPKRQPSPNLNWHRAEPDDE